jgi:hypothetical protein
LYSTLVWRPIVGDRFLTQPAPRSPTHVEPPIRFGATHRILNTKTAHSQIVGSVVGGIGMALHEETLFDHRFGRVMNANIAEYHVPVNADVQDIEVIFVDEPDEIINPLGLKGLGEIGIVGVAAAIASAVYHATGKARTRSADYVGQAAAIKTCHFARRESSAFAGRYDALQEATPNVFRARRWVAVADQEDAAPAGSLEASPRLLDLLF